MTLSMVELGELLTAVELCEMDLLGRGIVDAGLSHEELKAVLSASGVIDVQGAVSQLAQNGLVFQHAGLYRSRMAETVRLLTHLRQSFRTQPVTGGPPLVLDYRLIHKRRTRPKPFQTGAEFIQASSMRPLQEAVAQTLVQFDLYRYQVNAYESLAKALADRERRAVLIAAGTGSGKSLAFYLPALSHLVELVETDAEPWTKMLALYPRNELLKDQFASVLGWAVALHTAGVGRRPLRLGAWFQLVPQSASADVPKHWDRFDNGGAAVFPLASCPKCKEGDLVWSKQDRTAKIERLKCAGHRCGFATPDGMLGLTRESVQRHPPDIMFTTTESLNRQLADTRSHAAFGLSGDRRLRLVLVDEIHTYEGLTGAQNAFLFRRLAHQVASPIVWAGLSATLANPRSFTAQLTGLSEGQVEIVQPSLEDLEASGAEYLLALRHDARQLTSALALTIQSAMVLARCLDWPGMAFQPSPINSELLYGSKTFIFTDKLDVTNRLYWSLLDAEGWIRPGVPATKYKPLTLAHSRSLEQNNMKDQHQETGQDRDGDGQWWWMPEILGHDVGNDQQCNIERISSQSSGSVDKADIVVATATLEVGFSDDRVGAVIQHKAPGSAARFIQRKGRAGRQTKTRPWTVVTLSEWGRDRFAWQLYDQTLDPIVPERHLPLRNRYVQRVQATYATLDWLALRTSDLVEVSSVWSDLSGPAEMLHEKDRWQQRRRQRQDREAILLGAILNGGPEFDDWARHIKHALRIDDVEFEFLLSAPPRPLLLALIPTMRRRLLTQWHGERPDRNEANFRYRNPMSDFVPGSLFADLVSTDVSVYLPGATSGEDDEASETLPVARIIREFLPGNVTRHFGEKRGDRHWVPISLVEPMSDQTIMFDVDSAYTTQVAGSVSGRGGDRLLVLVPQTVRLATVPNDIRDSSSCSPDWDAELESLGTGNRLEMPKGALSGLVTSLTSHLHDDGDAVRIRRFVVRAQGRTTNDSGQTGALTVRFASEGSPVALGFEYEADGVRAELAEVPEQGLQHSERADFARELLESLTLEVDGFNTFNAAALYLAAECFVGNLVNSANSARQSLRELSEAEVHRQILATVRVKDGEDEDSSSQVKRLATLLSDTRIAKGIASALEVLVGGSVPDFARLLQRRLAATFGAGLLEAAMRLAPEVDEADLQLDISEDGRTVWLTEVAPGGNGQLSTFVRCVADSPLTFIGVIGSVGKPGEFEKLGNDLQAFVHSSVHDPETRAAAQALAGTWSVGSEAVGEALRGLGVELARSGVVSTQALNVSITARFLGPGADLALLPMADSYVGWVSQLELSLGFELDSTTAARLAAEQRPAFLAAYIGAQVPVAEAERKIDAIAWPRGRSAARFDLQARTVFGRLPSADRRSLVPFLGAGPSVLHLGQNDGVQIAQVLERDGRALVVADQSSAPELRRQIIQSQAEPIEIEGLFAYPRIEGLDLQSGKASVQLVLEEGATWHG